MNITSLSKEIFLSRDAIRSQIISEIQHYMLLTDVDLTKSSFVSYIINILSTLTANILFYQISVYKEYFLTKAQLNSSVINGAASIGYSPDNASYAKIDLLLKFPMRFIDPEVIFEIKKHTKFEVDSITFMIDYKLKFIITTNSYVECYQYTDDNIINKMTTMTSNYDDGTIKDFSVQIPAKQIEIRTEEFSVNDDNLQYRFTEYGMRLQGQVADIFVEVEEDGTKYIYKKFSSLYMMTSEDYGFTFRRSNDGITIYFGNGLIGKQPQPNSVIRVTVYITQGVYGNVSARVINTVPEIYVTSSTSGTLSRVNYTTSNPSAAAWGKNEPSLEEIKYLAIDNLTALHRLVSENDYKKVGSVLYDNPIAENTFPVLKRSDIRTNEIQLFSLLYYNKEIVPTENIYLTFNSDSNISIEKYQTFTFNNIEYITPFNIDIDVDIEITKYKYITNSIRYMLNIVSTSVSIEEYFFAAKYLYVETNNDTVTLKVYYETDQIDYSLVTCEMDVTNTLISLNMINNTAESYFELSLSPYSRLPENKETYHFTFTHPTHGQLSEYSMHFTFRKNLEQIMISNTIVDGNDVSVYDIPVIKKSYYDNLTDKLDFETFVLQRLVDDNNFRNTRMITDFINIKFANTSYDLKNMILNKETRLPIDYIYLDTFPHTPLVGERYIIGGTEIPEWEDRRNYIATCIKEQTATENTKWSYIKPEMDDILYVKDTDKKYIYTSNIWVEPIFNIPLLIEADVKMQDNYSIDNNAFINNIKTTIIEEYTDRMTCQSHLNRSELISTIHNVEGVDHCRLLHPISNIFYNFDLDDLTTEELLHFTPELLYFTIENISIRLVQ